MKSPSVPCLLRVGLQETRFLGFHPFAELPSTPAPHTALPHREESTAPPLAVRMRRAPLLRHGLSAPARCSGGGMKVAVAGCCHGALDKMYETLELLQRRHNVQLDLLLCCGDFQAVRNEADLRCMAVPAKYRHMQTFYR